MVTSEDIGFAHPRYSPGRVLGRGAQGVVLEVRDREDPARPLVAKLYRPGLFAESQLRAEFALLARLRVAGLVRAHDLGQSTHDAAPFLVEDLIDGPDARAWVQAAPETRVPRLVRVLGGAARALAALHEAGFLHGDLKPAHVRIAGELPVLLDLGAATAAVARARVSTFTAGFAAPEVCAGGRAEVTSDLYALGALAWSAAVGVTPPARPEPLRTRASWVPPRIADIVDNLLALHPQDRVPSALALMAQLGLLGFSDKGLAGTCVPPIGRGSELQALLHPQPHLRVRYLVGESGSGKSHLLRELRVAALLAGRTVRLLVPGDDGAAQLAHWAFVLRGQGDAELAHAHEPTRSRRALDEVEAGTRGRGRGHRKSTLLLVDALELAPPELTSAIESYRVLAPSAGLDPGIEVIAATRCAPGGAVQLRLGALSNADLTQLSAALGAPESQRERMVEAAAGSPGWLVATLGRVPLTAEAILARTRELPAGACRALAVLAAVGGRALSAWLTALSLDTDAIAAALSTGLVRRRALEQAGELRYELEAPHLSTDLARVLSTPELIAELSAVCLNAREAAPEALLALAGLAGEPTRTLLLTAAAEAARDAQARDLEIDALLGLGREPAARSFSLLARLERLLRDAGRTGEHAQVVGWLEAAQTQDDRIRALAWRRGAEQRAREGKHAVALELADAAVMLARERQDPVLEASALATRGAVRLFSADHAAAAADLEQARAGFARCVVLEDREELARLDHNLGVVALYRGELEEASARFKAAQESKRALGDRAGMRACLRNLGYTATRAGRYEEAAHWLEQALQLARSLKQVAGEAWSLVALAEVDARRGRSVEAERHLAEIEALGNEMPATVRADVALVRAELALGAKDFNALDSALSSLDRGLCTTDAQVDASRMLLGARAAQLKAAANGGGQPSAELRAAIRLSITAIRRAGAAQLALSLREAKSVLASALTQRQQLQRAAPTKANAVHERLDGGMASRFLFALSSAPRGEVAVVFVRHVAEVLGAERVFLVATDGVTFGALAALDLDGLPIAEPEQRVATEVVVASLDVPIEQVRSCPLPDGRGVRLMWSSSPASDSPRVRWVVVAEHRFSVDAFAGVTRERMLELGAWLDVCVRLAASGDGPVAARHVPQLSAADAPSSSELSALSSSALPLTTPRHVFPGILGSSRALRSALLRLDAAVDSDLPLLITGETGVGKEMFARAVAELGPRRGRPFVAVNCAAIADSLFESELFGHERGAFTGAERRRSGVFQQADGGVLLLDEVGELPLPQQVALLRALETQRVRPLGAETERKVDVRIIAATNRDLERAVTEGSFRRDLLYRINVLEVRVPSLRERPEDIEALALHFLRTRGATGGIAQPALDALRSYGWPGNVRELAHTMLRLSALHDAQIELAHLPRQIRAGRPTASVGRVRVRAVTDPKLEVLQTLERTGGNISHAARELGLTRHGLKKRMLRLGLRGPARGEGV